MNVWRRLVKSAIVSNLRSPERLLEQASLLSLLEDRGMVVVSHDNGREAIRHLEAQPNVDIVLMDIMMPEIDGIDTIREVRKIRVCKDLPIIAVTAKAMKGDRERCIEAGAWDYLSKPVETEPRRAPNAAPAMGCKPVRSRFRGVRRSNRW